MTSNAKEPTRPIGDPTPARDGTLRAKTTLTPKSCRVRARISVPPSHVMPIIVVPGIMGTNLRASTVKGAPANRALKPGEEAWRPPNSLMEGLAEAGKWKDRSPSTRQKILHGESLEVDPTGKVGLRDQLAPIGMDPGLARDYGWGEIHWDSYGELLMALRHQFSEFLTCGWEYLPPSLAPHWSALNNYDRKSWKSIKGSVIAPFTFAEIERLAQYWYPVYAFGYNWVLSNEKSAEKLKSRIEELIAHWNMPELSCERVLLVTHSMGGLVARACAKQVPEKIAGIVHACMPTLGAAVCYRRIACGTETSSPSNGKIQNKKADKFADIAGRTPAETNPVMAFSAGPLELLPTHLYPRPWLFASQNGQDTLQACDLLLQKDIYKFYGSTDVWYRLFQPDLIDPAKFHGEQAIFQMNKTVEQARRFHVELLGNYFHSNTYAIFGSDTEYLSFGQFKWNYVADKPMAYANISSAKFMTRLLSGGRVAQQADKKKLLFEPSVQEESGDGTVPRRSAVGGLTAVKGAFELANFSHQEVFSDASARYLMLALVAKAVLTA